MKNVRISGFLGIKDVGLALGARNLICGPNGAGKSSVQNAIRFALSADAVRVSLKKDHRLLIADGEKAATIDIDGSETHILPAKVVTSGVVMAEIIPDFLLDMEAFADADPAERSAMLNELSGALSPESLGAAAAVAGLDSEKARAVMPLVAASLQDAANEAARFARSGKAEWKGITGEVWGSEKAQFWRPVVDPEASAKMANVDAKIASTDEELTALLVQISDEERHIAPLRAACDGIDALEREYAEANSMREAAERVATSAESALVEANPWPELCGSLAVVAKAMENGEGEIACPCCSKSLLAIPADSGAPGLVGWAEAKAAVEAAASAIEEHAAARRDVGEFSTACGRLFGRLSKMRDAKARLGELLEGRTADFDLAAAKVKAEKLRASKNELFLRKQEIMRAAGVADQAEELAARAAAVNKAIGEWLDVAEFFSPTGAAAKLLSDSMGSVNAMLASYASATGWRTVVIADDFGVTYGGRELRLLSESERWRACAMIAVALVNLHGQGAPIILDRIDVLDLEGRGALIEWCAQSGGQWLLFGTLKARPTIDGFASFWIENGLICQ